MTQIKQIIYPIATSAKSEESVRVSCPTDNTDWDRLLSPLQISVGICVICGTASVFRFFEWFQTSDVGFEFKRLIVVVNSLTISENFGLS